MDQLIALIESSNTNTKIFLVNYYAVYPSDFGSLIYPNLQADVAREGFNSQRQTDYNNSLSAKFATNPNVKIIDVSTLYPTVITEYNGFPGDGVHLSENGMRSLADKITEEITPFLN